MVKSLKFPTNNIYNIILGIGVFCILLLYYYQSNDDKIIQIIVTLIIAEPHFFLTIPLLILYKDLFLENKIVFVYIPIIILFFSIFFFIYLTVLFYSIFLISNLFHVNRQSQGVVKLMFRQNAKILTNYLWIYYTLFSFLFIAPHLIAKLKFNFIYQNIVSALAILSFIILIRFLKNNNYTFKDYLICLSGLLIFWPALYFDSLLYAMGAGISIHYIQYIFLSTKIINNFYKQTSILIIILSLLIYCSFSTMCLSGYFSLNEKSLFILFPTLIQLFHFYYDSFIWRMSNQTVRDRITSTFSLQQ